MADLIDFAWVVLVVSGALLAALLSGAVTERLRVPAPVVYLLGAAVAASLVERLGDAVSADLVGRIGTAALVVILFEGGMQVGWPRFRASIVPIGMLGVLGTFATAGALTALLHLVLGLPWDVSAILGAALSPTDPAVTFSVLGNREVEGPSATILQGESGANDPVSIALMLGVLDVVTSDGSVAGVAVTFTLEMAVGVAAGVAGARLLRLLARMPGSSSTAPLRLLAGAGLVYACAALLHGSGFLAVFVAGILLGEDERLVHRRQSEAFLAPLAGLAEIAVFISLGLTVGLAAFPQSVWVRGVAAALLVMLVVRPLVGLAALLPVRMRRGDRLFVVWAGMKGAVPILLGSFALTHAAPQAGRIYGIVFIVVALTVLVQGLSMLPAARRLGVSMTARQG